MKFFHRLRTQFRKQELDKELSEELAFHIEKETEENIAAGMSAEDAHYAAIRKFGGVEQVKEECRDAWGLRFIDTLLQDLRFAVRILAKNPGFTVVAVLTLALGIGANTAIFSVVEGVVLAPLPFGQPDRLVVVREFNLHSKTGTWISYPNFRDWQRNARSFLQMAAFRSQGYDLTSPGTPEHLDGNEISAGFFTTLGVNLTLGRDFSRQEDRHVGAPVVIVSNRLWRNRLASSLEALGKGLTLNGVDYTIVGILPIGFHFEGDADVYTPLGQGDPAILNDRASHAGMLSIARLRPRVSISQAKAEMSTMQGGLDQLYPDADRDMGTDVVPLKQQIVGNAVGTLMLLLGAVGLVLLIACANFASLLLARSAARTREFAVRLALGANRARLVRQLLTESVLLSLSGGGLGLLVAMWGVKPMLAAVPGNLPRSENIGVNFHVLLFTLGVSIVVGILFGLAPALKSSKAELEIALKEGSRGSTNNHHHTQSGLVIVQMALTLVLLVGAGLLFRTIRIMWNVNPGFDTRQLIIFRMGLSPSLTNTPSIMRVAYSQLIERIREIPGVQAADLTELVPLSHQDQDVAFWLGPGKAASIQAAPRTLMFLTGSDYIRTMGIPLLRGHFFTPEDTTKSAPVIVIDTVFAQTYFPDRDPVGQTITFEPVGPCQIIGVVGHVRHWGLGRPNTGTESQSYFPLYQIPDEYVPIIYGNTKIIVRTPLDPAAVMPEIRRAVYGVGRDQPVYNIQTMQEIASESMSSQRFPMILLGVFAGLALLLASVGIYGVISYSVARRAREIGIRMALGAHKRDVFRMVIEQGLRLALAGLIIGIVAALVLTRLLTSLSSLVYGVGMGDPLTFITVSLVLSGVTVLACYIPARRATKVDPMVALRYE